MKTILIYDGSFKGFLTAVYTVFDKNLKDVSIRKNSQCDPDIFSREVQVETDPAEAARVWNSLRVKAGSEATSDIYRAFLSEVRGAEEGILEYVFLVYGSEYFDPCNADHHCIRNIRRAAQMVSRSEERSYELVVNMLREKGEKWASIQPDFNVLPLLAKRLSRELGSRSWVIYDRKRNYGFHFNSETLEPVFSDPVSDFGSHTAYNAARQLVVSGS